MPVTSKVAEASLIQRIEVLERRLSQAERELEAFRRRGERVTAPLISNAPVTAKQLQNGQTTFIKEANGSVRAVFRVDDRLMRVNLVEESI